MQIPSGDTISRNVSGSVAQPRPAPRQSTGTPQPLLQARTASNSPPPVDRAHSVERIAQGEVPRDVPRGSIIDIQA